MAAPLAAPPGHSRCPTLDRSFDGFITGPGEHLFGLWPVLDHNFTRLWIHCGKLLQHGLALRCTSYGFPDYSTSWHRK